MGSFEVFTVLVYRPLTYLPQIRNRLIGKRQRVKITRRTVFRRKGQFGGTGMLPRIGDPVPPVKMPSDFMRVLGCPRIRNLRALRITDTPMDMYGAGDSQVQLAFEMFQRRLGNAAPMAKIGRQSESRDRIQHLPRIPGIK